MDHFEASDEFRVIISGGGISGLTLANCLEKAGINYILLEARNNIAPKVGASLGIFAAGHRIFDQLGCLDAIEAETGPLHTTNSRYSNGELFASSNGPQFVGRRFGYDGNFLRREFVLRILYENLQDKSAIKLQKRVSQIDQNKDGIIVICEDGTAVSGDVLVGCDGVHSKVLNELWRLQNLEEPGSVSDEDKTSLTAEYTVFFGISSEVKGIKEGVLEVTYGEGSSSMIFGGRGETYWFMFTRLDRTWYKGAEIPRYTKEDAERFAEKIQDTIITTEVKFKDIWRNRTAYTLVATEEALLKQWSWGRIACIGDSVHKMTPNMGAGGMAAIETAAVLANELKKLKDITEKGKPSDETIRAHLGNYQKIREARISEIWKTANGLTRIHALQTLKDKILALYVLKYASEMFIDMHCDMVTGAAKLDYLPLPERSLRATMPFNPSQGLGKNESKARRAVKALPFLGITLLAVYFMWGVALEPVIARAVDIFENGVVSEIGRPGFVQPLRTFTGIDFIDSRIMSLSACFASFQFVDVIAHWQTFSFLTDLGIIYSIMLIEGARRINFPSVAYFVVVMGYNMQFYGIGVLMGLYCFAHYIQTPIENFRARDMRLTDISYTATILPVIILAHYIPNTLAFSWYLDPLTRHKWEWIWQPFPVLVSVLQYVLKKTIMPDTVEKDKIDATERDLPTIKFTILSLCALSTAVWHYTLFFAPYSPLVLFMPNVAASQTGDEFIRLFLQFDQIFSASACFLWLLYLFGDMKNAGMLDASWLSIIGRGLATLVFAGPGVTVGLGWLWRENILATKWHKGALVADKNN